MEGVVVVMKNDRKVIAGDRASFNPVEIVLPRGVTRAELKGVELLPEVLAKLGRLQDDPDDLILSSEGARNIVLGIAQNHLDNEEEPPSRDGWKKVRNQLKEIKKTANSLHKALASTYGLTALALLRTGSQMSTQEFLHRLDRLKQDVGRALELVPENNMGDAVTALGRLGTSNEMLVLGCQNLLFACGDKSVGATHEGRLEHFASLVKRLALGRECAVGGLSAGAMRSGLLKGRYKSKNLRFEALLLISGDAERRRGPDSDLARRAEAELTKWAE